MELNRKLLEKIEELTLYIIRQQRDPDALREEFGSFRAEEGTIL